MTTPGSSDPLPSPAGSAPPARRPLFRNPWFWGVVACIAVDSLFRFTPLLKRIPDPPEVLVEVGDFSVVDQDGLPFTPARLEGAVHLTGFFFTTCTSYCPRLIGSMRELQETMKVQEPYEKYGTDLRLLGITVDPDTDTPERLRQYMQEMELDPELWTLVTGEREAIRELVEGGFAQAMGERQEVSPGMFDIAHSMRLAMLDEDGGVRGFYETDEEGLDKIFWLGVRTLRDQRIRARKAERGCR